VRCAHHGELNRKSRTGPKTAENRPILPPVWPHTVTVSARLITDQS